MQSDKFRNALLMQQMSNMQIKIAVSVLFLNSN